MGDFLDRVVREKEIELAQKRRSVPEAELRTWGRDVPVRDFAAAVGGARAGGADDRPSAEGARDGGALPSTRIIAEIKRCSPSVPAFRQQGPVESLAGIYAAHGAVAISVVTDTPNFGMRLADVEPIRVAGHLPVLVKEFVIDPYQVFEARAHGADALLLIVRILSPERLAELCALVRELGMAALVECHDEADMRVALAAGARIIGINHRNLATLAVSLDHTQDMLASLPPGVISVSESGIETREQIERLSAAGSDAFLIGTALLQSSDPGATLRRLRGEADRG